jgi:hypothetical protein
MTTIKNKILLRDLILFALMGPVVLLFWENNSLVTTILLLEFVVAGLFLYSWTERLFFVMAGVFGLVLEIIGGLFGIWTYTFPNFVTVPVWIFFCWGFTLTLFNSIFRAINNQ